jgi:CBS domain-containing protein
MSADPAAVSVETSIVETARIMRDKAVSEVLVTDQGLLCGVVTERDMAVRAVATDLPGSTPVVRIAGPVRRTCAPQDDAERAATLLRDHPAEHVPVIEDGRLVGVVGAEELARMRDEP